MTMLKLLRWPAVIILLAILFTHPLAVSGLAFMTWLVGRAAVNHPTPIRLLTAGITALAGSLFLQLTIAPFTTITLVCFIVTLTVISARVFNPPFQPKAAAHRPPRVDDDGIIEADYKIISERIIER